MSKVMASARDAVAGVVSDGMTIAVGGFGLCGIPSELIRGIRDSGSKNLTIVSNNMGVDGKGLGLLLENNQVSKVLASYVGENKLFAQQYLDGSLEVEFVPQGTLAERLRAGGAGIPAFFTPTGAGTPVAQGKETRDFGGVQTVLEKGIRADLSLVHAFRADPSGNLVYRLTARNFNPLVAMASTMTIAEVEHISEDFIDPENVMTPGVFVQRIVHCPDAVKNIEQLTVRERA